MKLPINDKKFIFLLSAIIIVVALEVLSIIGIHIPMPYAPFIFGAFILGIGHSVVLNGLKAATKQLEFRGAQRACHETPVERDRFLWGCRELILNFCR